MPPWVLRVLPDPTLVVCPPLTEGRAPLPNSEPARLDRVSPSFLTRTLVLIPALDEADTIGATVRAWRALGARWVRVVDNGSTDLTTAEASHAGAGTCREDRRGYGAAAWRGLQELPAGADWILFSSADGSDRLGPAEMGAWQDAVDSGADFVLGNRCASRESRFRLKPSQRWGNTLACVLIWVGWRRRFADLGSLRLCRRAALEALQLEDRGFGWNVEMQVRALEAGFKIVEIPVTFHPRAAGTSKISGSWRGTLRAGSAIIGMTVRLWTRRRGRWRARELRRDPINPSPL